MFRPGLVGIRGSTHDNRYTPPPPPLSMEKFSGYKTEVKERIEERERPALRNKVKEEKHLEIYRGLREDDIGMKTSLHGPMDYAKNLIG